MTKKMVKKEDELLAEWQSLNQGGQGKRTNYIQLVNQPLDEDGNKNPDYGKLFAVHFDEAGDEIREEIDIEAAEFFLVKVRKQIVCKDQDSYWCREADLFDLITVFDENDNKVAVGEYRDLKEQYNLKFTHAAYVWYNDRLYRWKITGAHFSQSHPDTNWFTLKSKIDRTKRPHTFRVTHLTDEKSGSIHFKSMHFEMGKEYPLKDAVKIAHELDKGLAAYYDGLKKNEAKIPNGSTKCFPPVDEDVKVDNLPF